MTIVQFFDCEQIYNVDHCMIKSVDKVVYLGTTDTMTKQRQSNLLKFIDTLPRDFRYETDFIEFDPNGPLDTLVDLLLRQAESLEDASYDLNGGPEILFVALGIVFNRLKALGKNPQLHRYDDIHKIVVDIDNDGILVPFDNPSVKLSQIAVLYGGKINNMDSLSKYHFTDRKDALSFMHEASRIWSVCNSHSDWNRAMSYYESAVSNALEIDEQTLEFKNEDFRLLEENGVLPILKDLEESNEVSLVGSRIIYKNNRVKAALEKQGNALELITYMSAIRAEIDGLPMFYDVQSGVTFDWDGLPGIKTFSGTVIDIVNEIDVTMMYGLTPVFISCKNGRVDEAEIFKFNSVVEHFGHRNAIKILVATTKGISNAGDAFKYRCKQMGIHVIDNANALSDKSFINALKKCVLAPLEAELE